MVYMFFNIHHRPCNVLLKPDEGSAATTLHGRSPCIVSTHSDPMHVHEDMALFKFKYLPSQYLIIAHLIQLPCNDKKICLAHH